MGSSVEFMGFSLLFVLFLRAIPEVKAGLSDMPHIIVTFQGRCENDGKAPE